MLLSRAAAAACAPGGAPPAEVEFIAHRGESADAPENTLASFRLAWERHDRAIELDTHLTADGKLIVSHDGNTKRTTGADMLIKHTALADLHALDAGSWKGSQFVGEKLPLLLDVLTTIPAGGRCFVEIKCGPEATPELVRVVRESRKKPEQLVLISFNAEALASAKRALPKLKGYYLASTKHDAATDTWSPSVDDLIAHARKIGADGLDLAATAHMDAAYVRKVKDAGLGFYVWAVDSPDAAKRLIEAGVDGITSNRAAWLREQVR